MHALSDDEVKGTSASHFRCRHTYKYSILPKEDTLAPQGKRQSVKTNDGALCIADVGSHARSCADSTIRRIEG